MKNLINKSALIGLFAAAFAFAGLVQAEEVKQTHQGQTLNANLVMAEGKGYADEFVLLLHGTLTHKGRSTYTILQDNLAAQGVSSLSINLSLGLNDRQGEYDCNVPHTHKHTDALNEVGVWLDWLKKQGANKVTLMGHSRGGNQIAWFAAEHDRAQIDKVVLIAPATSEQQSPEDYQKKYDKPLSSVLNKAQKLVDKGQADQMMKNVDFIYCEKAQVTAGAFVDYYTAKPQFDTPYLIKAPAKRTLVVVASEDQAVPELPERLAPLEGTPNLSIKTIDGADHFFMDFFNEDLAAMAVEFIKN